MSTSSTNAPAVQPTSTSTAAPSAPEDTQYPEQLHAGAVGLGPNYGQGVSTGDKLSGMKDEVKGKILHKPDIAEHGRQLRTGELKHQEEANETNPFQAAKPETSEARPTKDIDHPNP